MQLKLQQINLNFILDKPFIYIATTYRQMPKEFFLDF